MVSKICLFLSIGYMILCVLLRNISLRKYNVKLKMKLTELALKTDNDIYAIYNVSKEDKVKIMDLKKQNKKIDAVKLLKDNYSLSLYEAKSGLFK